MQSSQKRGLNQDYGRVASMDRDHNQIWSNCLRIIKSNVNEQSYKTWFRPIRAVRIIDNALTIQVPNKFFYEFLEERYVPVLKKAIREQLGPKGRLEYQIHTGNGKDSVGSAGNEDPQTGMNGIRGEEIKNPFVIPGIVKPSFDSQLKPKYQFDTFIEGDCNRLARNAGLAIAKRPGETAFNPLYIYGDTGLGKTHLAQAIGNRAKEINGDVRALYVTTEKFTNQIIHSIKNSSVNELVNFYNTMDILIVDDIQFLAGREKTQEIFFNIFNQLQQNGKQIILTSDRPPKELKDLNERLISRFKWGLSADLGLPDFETRYAILQAKLEDEQFQIPDNVLEFISFSVQTNIRELEGALILLNAEATLNQREVNMDLAKEVVQKMVNEMAREITVENIQALVAEHYNIQVEKIQGKTRRQPIVEARQLSMFMAKKMTQQSLKAIGQSFGGRDHSTVIYSCRTVQNMMDTNEDFRKNVNELEKKIRMSLHA